MTDWIYYIHFESIIFTYLILWSFFNWFLFLTVVSFMDFPYETRTISWPILTFIFNCWSKKPLYSIRNHCSNHLAHCAVRLRKLNKWKRRRCNDTIWPIESIIFTYLILSSFFNWFLFLNGFSIRNKNFIFNRICLYIPYGTRTILDRYLLLFLTVISFMDFKLSVL